MAADTYGLTSVTYGTPTHTGFVVQSSTVSSKTGVVAEVFDETGNRVHVRYDDLTNEVTLEMIVNGGTLPEPGNVLTFNAIAYEVISVDVKQANKDFKRISVKGKNSAHVALA